MLLPTLSSRLIPLGHYFRGRLSPKGSFSSEQNPACVRIKTLYLSSLALFQASHTFTSFHRASYQSPLHPPQDLNAVKNDSSPSQIAFDNNSAEAPLAAGEGAAPIGSRG